MAFDQRRQKSLPFFSVFIPTSGRAKLIREAIQSVREQTCQDFEIIVADSSGTKEAAAAAGVGDARVRLVHASRDTGPLDTFNVAARAARGKYLLGLDDDNYLLPHALDLFRRAAEESGADIITASHLYYYDASHPRRFLRNSIGVIPFSGEKKYIDPRAAIEGLFAFEERGPGCRLPRFHFSATVVSRRVIERVMERLGYILFPNLPNAHSLQPILFAHSRSCFFVDQPVVIVGRLGISMSQVWSTAAHARFRREKFSFSKSPLAAATRLNAVLENYLRVQEVLPDLTGDIPIDYERFAQMHVGELVYLDADAKTAYRNWREFFLFLKTLSPPARAHLVRKSRRAALRAFFVFASRRLRLHKVWRILYGAFARSKQRRIPVSEKIRGSTEVLVSIPSRFARAPLAGFAPSINEILAPRIGKKITP